MRLFLGTLLFVGQVVGVFLYRLFIEAPLVGLNTWLNKK